MQALGRALMIFCSLAATNAQADNWVKIVGNQDQIAISMNTDSIHTSGGIVEGWELFNFEKPDLFQGKAAYSVKYFYYRNCSDRTAALAHGLFYGRRNGEGAVISDNLASEVFYMDVIPGTVGDKTLDFVCTYARNNNR
ncbi:MAG: surface-adhesin E family protein [Pseudomonadota bacterium]